MTNSPRPGVVTAVTAPGSEYSTMSVVQMVARRPWSRVGVAIPPGRGRRLQLAGPIVCPVGYQWRARASAHSGVAATEVSR
jgi:hypothetical protein